MTKVRVDSLRVHHYPSRTLYILRGSVETLSRRGEKVYKNFAANLFRKLYTKFYQNRQGFIGDFSEKNWPISYRGEKLKFVLDCRHQSLSCPRLETD